MHYRYKENRVLYDDAATGYKADTAPGVMDPLDYVWTDGTSSNQADAYVAGSITIGAGATSTVDLRAKAGPDGVTKAFAEVRKCRFRVPTTATAGVEITPSAANGWAGTGYSFLKAVGDVLPVQPGCTSTPIDCGVDGKYAMNATHKDVDITNLDGANPVTITYEIIGTLT